MPRESLEHKKQRSAQVFDALDADLPEAEIQLGYRTPLELLVAVILSAQCTDKRVNLVTPALFRKYRTAQDYADADVAELEQLIQSCGLYRSKARNLIAAGAALAHEHGGQVPASREELEALPGVGKKTAGVVSIHLGTDFAFPVDTHVKRLAHRLGFTRHTDPDKVELDLRALLPRERWTQGHQLLIWHGRRTCTARAPACDRCVVRHLCPRVGVERPNTSSLSGPRKRRTV